MLSYYKICKCDSGILWTSNVQDVFAERIMRQVENGSGELVGQNMPQVLAALLQKQGNIKYCEGFIV